MTAHTKCLNHISVIVSRGTFRTNKGNGQEREWLSRTGKYYKDRKKIVWIYVTRFAIMFVSDNADKSLFGKEDQTMQPTRKQPLFIITGASCVGKSTMCNELFQNEKDYIVMESDLLWYDYFDTPDDDYCEYRRMWMRVCANISQIGKPVVLCGCAIPKQFENQPERELFTGIFYMALVCDKDKLISRMVEGRKVKDSNWIDSSVSFNEWLKDNALKTVPQIELLDTSTMSYKETAEIIDKWISSHL